MVGTALDILKKDFMNVLEAPVHMCDASQADIVITTSGKGPREGFSLRVEDGHLVIEGTIDEIHYSDTAAKGQGGFFARLFQ